ncbi:MAG: AzlC family ABC transporter permease [Clostridia bacterium]|nr:AzlC family ABC transporter permease [Clostridia bacterium]
MKKQTYALHFPRGLRLGIPIALGYLSVSFGFGIAAVNKGLSPLAAVLISLTNLTSAGQVAGLEVIVTGGTLVEMALTQHNINLRYFLKSISLSQKLSPTFSLPHRLLASFGITDEIFGVSSAEAGEVTPSYMYGLLLLPFIGWSLGTLLGAVAGNILPSSVKYALGIAIYGMFVAIILPPAKKDHGIQLAAGLSIAFSLIIAYVPLFSFITSGFSVIICAILASVVAALLFPIPDESEETA